MRYLYLIITNVIFLQFTSTFGQNISNNIIGQWQIAEYRIVKSDNSEKLKSITTNLNNLISTKTTYTINNDNSLIKSENPKNNYHYDIIDNKLIISHIQKNDSHFSNSETITFKIENNKLIFIYNPTEAISFEISLINNK